MSKIHYDHIHLSLKTRESSDKSKFILKIQQPQEKQAVTLRSTLRTQLPLAPFCPCRSSPSRDPFPETTKLSAVSRMSSQVTLCE